MCKDVLALVDRTLVEALYLCGSLEFGGTFPIIFPPSPRDAFRNFEAAASHDCFERGGRGGRRELLLPLMGMAHIQSQLAIAPPNIYALLLGEFLSASVSL